MKTFRNFILDEFDIEMPHGEISGAWFSQNGFPHDCRLHLLRHDHERAVRTD